MTRVTSQPAEGVLGVYLRADDAKLDRLLIWLYYYLGVRDGMSVSLQFLNSRNPEDLKDAEWRTMLRSWLPPELASLREPHAKLEPAVRLITQQITDIKASLHSKKRTKHKAKV